MPFFPTTGVLDDFNRANQGPPPSASWGSTGTRSGTPSLVVNTNQLQDTSGGFTDGGVWGQVFGPDCEVFTTIQVLANLESVYLFGRAVNVGTGTTDGYLCIFERRNANPGFAISAYRVDNGATTLLGATVNDTAGTFAAGTKVGVGIVGSEIAAYIQRPSGAWINQLTRTDATYTTSGSIGLSASNTASRFDDFGGGTAVPTMVYWIQA